MESTSQQIAPETRLRSVIDDDETLLWSGRPNVDVVLESLKQKGRRASSRTAILFVLFGGAFAFVWMRNGGAGVPFSLEQVVDLLKSKAMIPVAAVLGIAALLRLVGRKGLDDEGQVESWLRAQCYGITDRRVLILSGDSIEDELGPEDFSAPRIRDRADGYADVVLKIKSRHGHQRANGLHREKLRVAFRAIPNAVSVKQQVEDWRQKFRLEGERDAQAFLDSPAGAARQPGVTAGARTIRNDRYGVTVSIPDNWAIKVRKRRKPYGRVFLDFERWKTPDALPDWNVLKAEGDYLTDFEMHLDQVRKPVMVYQKARHSALINAVTGAIVESDGDLSRGNFTGFSITRRHVEHRPDQGGADRDRPALRRWMMLHDGQLQIGAVMTWPEDSGPLKQAMSKVVDSIRVD